MHHEERLVEVRRIGLHPGERRYRHAALLGDEIDQVVLLLEVVRREDRNIACGRRDPSNERAAALPPRGIEEKRFARHAVRLR
ncbi:MAG: hypothetical protein EBY44_06160 [Actinobacteria bacterium]|nr:hypothetical protein [Actinomycetota bacterium]